MGRSTVPESWEELTLVFGLLCHHTILVPCFFPFFFVGLFVVIKPENPFFTSRSGLEANPLGVYALEPCNSFCGPTKGTPPPGTTVRAN